MDKNENNITSIKPIIIAVVLTCVLYVLARVMIPDYIWDDLDRFVNIFGIVLALVPIGMSADKISKAKKQNKPVGKYIAILSVCIVITFAFIVGIFIGGVVGKNNNKLSTTSEFVSMDNDENMAEDDSESVEDNQKQQSVNSAKSETTTTARNEFSYVKVGDYIKFGKYPQNNEIPENIEWEVLEISNRKVFVVSRYAIDVLPFDTVGSGKTWKDCTLRKWMNDNFFNVAFTPAEQKRILTTNISTPNNPENGTYGGANTQDKIFCLSIDEVNKFFPTPKSRIVEATWYTMSKNAFVFENPHNSNLKNIALWWLRSPGQYSGYGTQVSNSGDLYYGDYVFDSRIAVRPALCINFEL